MQTNKKFLIVYKLFFALLGFSAIVTEIAVIVERHTFNPINFFSFFTVQVNIVVLLTFLLSVIVIAGGKQKKWLDILRSATTVYILMVGIGFSVLLAGLEGVALTAVPWDNTVLHYIIPIAVAVDFMIDRPSSKLRFKHSLVWLVYPVAYAVYSLVRGAFVGWYPYPFLNPSTNGIEGIVIAVLGLMVLGLLLVAVIVGLTGRSKPLLKRA